MMSSQEMNRSTLWLVHMPGVKEASKLKCYSLKVCLFVCLLHTTAFVKKKGIIIIVVVIIITTYTINTIDVSLFLKMVNVSQSGTGSSAGQRANQVSWSPFCVRNTSTTSTIKVGQLDVDVLRFTFSLNPIASTSNSFDGYCVRNYPDPVAVSC